MIIRITGEDWWKEFICHGGKNVSEVCEDCILKFQCFTTKDKIEMPELDLPDGLAFHTVDARDIADFIVPTIKVATRLDKHGKRKVQINFNKVRKFL